ncbi:MAG: hypothetical protein Q9195_003999 [Heterodermia aff. obscurata]
MVPPFGFSVGDFINTIGLAHQIRKALKDVGGSEDDIKLVLQDLQQLELVLIQLRDGNWAKGGDLNHINAVRGIAVSCEADLKDFLQRVEGFSSSMIAKTRSSTRGLTRTFKQAHSANGVRHLVLAKDAGGTDLWCGDSAALKRLEDSTLGVSDLLKEKANSLMFDPGKCQLTIQIKRESLDEVQHELASSESTAGFDNANQRLLRKTENSIHKGQISIGKDSNDIDIIQRRTLALIPTGMKDFIFL